MSSYYRYANGKRICVGDSVITEYKLKGVVGKRDERLCVIFNATYVYITNYTIFPGSTDTTLTLVRRKRKK